MKAKSFWLLALLGLSWPLSSAAASRASGWEEQSWRSAFLAQHERWKIISRVQLFDTNGDLKTSGSLAIMRAGLTRHEDPAVDLVLFSPDDGSPRWFVRRENETRFFEGGKPVLTLDTAQWWSSMGATSLRQWIAWVAGLPEGPRQGRCHFCRPAGGPALFSTCRWEGYKVHWQKWASASGQEPATDAWSLWLPMQVQVNTPDGSRVLIQTQGFEARMHGEGEKGWPFTLYQPSENMSEPEVPLEDLDYQDW